MALYKKYKEQNNFTKKLKRPSSTRDTTIPNMMGHSGTGSTNMDSKDYGKIKSKGGVSKASTVVNNYKKKK